MVRHDCGDWQDDRRLAEIRQQPGQLIIGNGSLCILRVVYCGGNYNNGANAGVFYCNGGNNSRTNANGNIGFRSALPHMVLRFYRRGSASFLRYRFFKPSV